MSNLPQDNTPNSPDESKPRQFGDSLQLPPTRAAQEKSPGVYVRQYEDTTNSDDALDLLWASNSPAKVHLNKEERHPVFMFVTGLGTGVMITLLAFVVFVNRPMAPTAEQAAANSNGLMTPIERLQSTLLPPGGPAQGRTSSRIAVPDKPVEGNDNPAVNSTETPGAPVAPQGSQIHVVRSGDTLGGIASKYYDNSGPEWVEKIQRANSMSNADTLSLDQKLIIPPKSY
jgi:LysM repeat protein